MAIQNFVGGGFKGKLGAVIGQGWKSQKVLRTYQKPANPRTKKQQANRGNFAQCVKMAQLAMQMNWKSKLFQSDETTQWSIRIGTARKTFDKSMHEMYCLPLLPYGTVAKYGIADGYQKITGGIQFTVNAEEDLSGRTVSVLLYAFDTQKAEYDYFVLQSTVGYANSANTIDVMLPENVELAENSLAALVSNDDDVFSDEIYMPTRPLGKIKEVVYFTLSNPTVSWVSGDDDVQIDFTPSIAVNGTESSAVTQLSAHGVLQGKWGDYDTDGISLISANRLSAFISGALDSLNQRVQFPAGANITVGAFAFSDDDYIYTHEEETITFSETVAQQQGIAAELLEYLYEQSFVTLKVKDTAYTIAGNHSGTAITLPTVIDGVASTRGGNILQIVSNPYRINFLLNQEYNYWGKERNATVNLSGITVTANGVVYALRDNDTIAITPSKTSIAITASNITLRLEHFYTSSGTLYRHLAIKATGIGSYASLFTTATLPASITVVAYNKTFTVSGFQNAVFDNSNLLRSNYSGSWQGTYDEEPFPTFSTSFRQNVVQTSEVANSDGFTMGINIATSDVLNGEYESYDNS